MNQPLFQTSPRASRRTVAAPCRPRPISTPVSSGRSLLAALTEVMAHHQCRGGMLWLEDLVCDQLLSSHPRPAAGEWFAPPLKTRGRLRRATASLGWRHGVPFAHIHGLIDSDQGEVFAHLCPQSCILGQDAVLRGYGLGQTWFEAVSDVETGFTLFSPQGGEAGQGLLLRLLPQEDLITSLEGLAAKHHLTQARLMGLGTLQRLHLRGSRPHEQGPYQIQLLRAHLRDGIAEIEVEAANAAGDLHRGWLAQEGQNPVAITLEMLALPDPAQVQGRK